MKKKLFGLAMILLLTSRVALASGIITNLDIATFFLLVAITPLCFYIGFYLAKKKTSLQNSLVVIVETIIFTLVVYGCTDLTLSSLNEVEKTFLSLILLSQFFLFSPFAIKQIKMRWTIDRFNSEYSRTLIFKFLIFLGPIALFVLVSFFTWVYSRYTHYTEEYDRNQRWDHYIKAQQSHEKATQNAKVARFKSGQRDLACEISAKDTLTNLEIFTECKHQIEASKNLNQKWEKLSLFLEGNDGFSSRYNNQIDGSEALTRDWNSKKVLIPTSEQAWFISTFFETWMKLNDDQVTETLMNIQNAFFEISRYQNWSSESKKVLNKEFKQRLIERINKASSSERAFFAIEEISKNNDH